MRFPNTLHYTRKTMYVLNMCLVLFLPFLVLNGL